MTARSRRRSRILAFQALFEADATGRSLRSVLQRHLAEAEVASEAAEFAEHLVRGVAEHQEEIDAEIERLAPAYPLADMSSVDRNVLRLALFEILFDDRAPLRVAITEAVELAKGYGSESSGRFVHGVLGSAVAAVDAVDREDVERPPDAR